jgi:hypothetical protein
VEEPLEDVTDRILFIINNLAPSNFNAKLLEMCDLPIGGVSSPPLGSDPIKRGARNLLRQMVPH